MKNILLCSLLSAFALKGLTRDFGTKILEDNPFINRLYVNVGAGFNVKTNLFASLEARTYLKDAKFCIDGQLGIPISRRITNGEVDKKIASGIADVNQGFLSPVDGIKSNFSYQLGGVYNFLRRFEDKPYRLDYGRKTRGPGGIDTLHVPVGFVHYIVLAGIRAGFGSYTNTVVSKLDGYFNKTTFNPSSEMVTAYPNHRMTDIAFNTGTLYGYVGFQRTLLRNYKLNQGIFPRKTDHFTYFVDILIPFSHSMSDVRLNADKKEYTIDSPESLISKFGFRIGLNTRPVTTVRVSTGFEIGSMPGHKFLLDTNQETSTQGSFYFSFRLSIGITGKFAGGGANLEKFGKRKNREKYKELRESIEL